VASIAVKVVIEAPPAAVWEAVRDIPSHVRWMADAESITITSPLADGVGTTFDCLTKVGPLRLTDKMEVTEWVEGRVMGVRHVGLVTGTGKFTLSPVPGGATEFAWAEDLRFPWWMGGPLGGLVGGQLILRAIWRRNLSRLKHLIETDPSLR
jgi:hypothetical protein